MLADTIIVYTHGRIAQVGSPEEISRNPSCEEVALLMDRTDNELQGPDNSGDA
jgi:ABC-type Fe3+/spermidine/putrescine transport system ATPase subunit